MDDLNLPEIQMALNQLLYADIYKYLKNLSDVTNDAEQSFHLILAALSTNMGLLLSQVSDSNRETYVKICKDIIDKSCNAHIKISDELSYGQVGHA